MKAKAVILDSQLLLLLIVGSAKRSYIARHRRLQDYSVADFSLLVKLISSTPEVVVTPNTLTETSNLARYIAEPARSHISEMFRLVAKSSNEIYRASGDAVEREEFLRLGLADAVLLDLADEAHILLTADLQLYLSAISRGHNAAYFAH